MVCRLKRLLYGLNQAPKQWHNLFDSYMIQINYTHCEAVSMLKVLMMVHLFF